jgi:hypothetical protein
MTKEEKIAAVVSAVKNHYRDEDEDDICWGYWWNEGSNKLADSGHGACHSYLNDYPCMDASIVGSVIMPPRGCITEEEAQEFYRFLLDPDVSPYASLLGFLGDDLVVVRDDQDDIVGLVYTRNFNNKLRINFFKAFRDPCEHPSCTASWLEYKDYNPTLAFGLSHFFHNNGDRMVVDHSVMDTYTLRDGEESGFNIGVLLNPKGKHWEFNEDVGKNYRGEMRYTWGGKFDWSKDIPQKGKKVRTPAQKAFFYNKYYDKDPEPGSYTPEELIHFLENAKEIIGNAA